MSDIRHTGNNEPSSAKEFAGYGDLAMLIKDCIAQVPLAQKKMYDLYAPGAYGVVRRYIYNDDTAADEILNDSFYKVLTKLDQYSFQGAFEGWVRRIVVNTITDHLRKKLANDHQHREVQPEDAFTGNGTVDRIAHKELLLLIQGLPDVQRAVFNLYVVENYSHKEIATFLSLSENNSRWYLNDARKRLKEKISFIHKY